MATDVRSETVWTLLRAPAARATSRAAWAWLLLLGLTAWVGAIAFIGRYRMHEVVRALYALAPREVLYMGALVITTGVFVGARMAGRRGLSGAALVVTAFLAGHQLYAWVYGFLPANFDVPFATNGAAIQFALGRLAYGAALVAPMLVAWRIAFGGTADGVGLRLGPGDMRVAARDFGSPDVVPWSRQLVGGYALFCLVLFVLMQANVGFRPILSGNLLRFLPAVLIAACANALAEEYIFRGVLQPAFIRAGGVAAGLWMQGLTFGLMHWGMSVGVLAALPVSLLIGLGSVVWGKAALDTGGMAWVVIAHAMVDVAVMGAFFVPAV
jgi:membrane protease YdiL (CAAX protease family)